MTYETRCRKCPACLKARMTYWALAAVSQTKAAHEQGRRTWFGTLTLRPEAVAAIKDRALEKWLDGQGGQSVEVPGWIEQPECDYRFVLMRDELVKEVQLYWKRLRKAGYRFKYFLVFERHKSGDPHMHFLLHEAGERILKKSMQAEWPHGFTQIKLVGGNGRQNASPDRVAWYVAKYLGKTSQSRQIASVGYRPSRKQDVRKAPLAP